MAQRPSDKPAPKTPILDLDAVSAEVEKETADKEPFKVAVGGKEVVLLSLDDLDWEKVQDLAEDMNPRDFLYAVIEDDEQLNLFFNAGFKPPVLERLMRDYYRHYELEMPGEARLNRAARRRRR